MLIHCQGVGVAQAWGALARCALKRICFWFGVRCLCVGVCLPPCSLCGGSLLRNRRSRCSPPFRSGCHAIYLLICSLLPLLNHNCHPLWLLDHLHACCWGDALLARPSASVRLLCHTFEVMQRELVVCDEARTTMMICASRNNA